ncbi:unnamed protein product, partial [Chrysoparadoxa australica]
QGFAPSPGCRTYSEPLRLSKQRSAPAYRSAGPLPSFGDILRGVKDAAYGLKDVLDRTPSTNYPSLLETVPEPKEPSERLVDKVYGAADAVSALPSKLGSLVGQQSPEELERQSLAQKEKREAKARAAALVTGVKNIVYGAADVTGAAVNAVVNAPATFRSAVGSVQDAVEDGKELVATVQEFPSTLEKSIADTQGKITETVTSVSNTVDAIKSVPGAVTEFAAKASDTVESLSAELSGKAAEKRRIEAEEKAKREAIITFNGKYYNGLELAKIAGSGTWSALKFTGKAVFATGKGLFIGAKEVAQLPDKTSRALATPLAEYKLSNDRVR